MAECLVQENLMHLCEAVFTNDLGTLILATAVGHLPRCVQKKGQEGLLYSPGRSLKD